MKIYLIRHGQTDWNVQGRIMGDKDIPLNPTGVDQMQFASEFLKEKGIAKIFSSPVLRCRQSAEILSKCINAPVETDAGFTETGFGQWVGKIYEDQKKNPGFRHYYSFPDEEVIPGGEKFGEVQKRVLSSYRKLLKGNRDTAIVTHADPIKVIVLNTLKAESSGALHFRIDNASITCIEINKKPVIRFVNYHSEIISKRETT